MIGRVGQDAFGDQLLTSAQADGINVNHVGRDDSAATGELVDLFNERERRLDADCRDHLAGWPALVERYGGEHYDELHVDGGAASQVFLYPIGVDYEAVLDKLEVNGGALIVDVKDNEKLRLSARNLQGHSVLPPEGVNLYDLLRHEHLVLTQTAVEALEARCQ